jgi:hypothetical protein
MEEDPLKAALSDWEGEGGSVGLPAPERSRSDRTEEPHAVDGRQRRASLGPHPVAIPLGETASGAQLHAHLAQLLDMRGNAPAPSPDTEAVTAEPRADSPEDVERQPDGVPHLVIGLTALFSVLFAAVLIGVFLSGSTLGIVAAVALAVVAIPVLVFRLDARAERDRDHEHPSR